ncbi:hypothetical protein [uncultured Roseobacter sp.]|uniref:hypothetical protein n=1 Tax=uncultured Roseobacter sp. TaxID=114847 RepID=UPI0026075EDA|nr:hypothetical protein [uncultured Roseobacter sp.]
MNIAIPNYAPVRTAIAKLAKSIMDVILHLGAHRTAVTGFQDYLVRNRAALGRSGVAFWVAGHHECELPAGLVPRDGAKNMTRPGKRTAEVVRKRLREAQDTGADKLIISDANMMGPLGESIRAEALYPNAGTRLSRIAELLDGKLTGLMMSVRCLDPWWCSVLAAGVSQGNALPGPDSLRRIAGSGRGWRDVIREIGTALPGVPLRVMPMEQFAGRSDAVLKKGADIASPPESQHQWLNRAPTLPELRRAMQDRGENTAGLPFGMGRWNPFDNEQHSALRELYSDDKMWLAAGADGLATLTEDDTRTRAAKTQPVGMRMEGHRHEPEKRPVAGPR